MFFRGSRYEHVPETEIALPDGRTVRCKRMRFPGPAEPALREIVREGDRPDLVAYRVLGDPEQFWRLCDINGVMRPVDLSATPGRIIRVPGPGLG